MSSLRLRAAIEANWAENILKTSLWQAIEDGRFDTRGYIAYLAQTYHYTRRSALIQASAIPHFQVDHYELVAPFLKHAAEESDHYRLALQDIKRLGGDPVSVENAAPSPLTEGYLGFIFNQIQHVNPLAYLGYLYQLEYMAIKLGPPFAKKVAGSVPGAASAMAFLKTHAHDDVDHVAELDQILESVTEKDDLECIFYTANTAASLYSAMMEQAFERSRGGQT